METIYVAGKSFLNKSLKQLQVILHGSDWKKKYLSVLLLSFQTDRSGQRVQTQIRLWVYTVCNSVCIFWMHYSRGKQSCSNFRVITVWIFRIFTVKSIYRNDSNYLVRSKDPDQTAPSGAGAVWSGSTVCHQVCIFWIYYCMVNPHCSNFRTNTAIIKKRWLLVGCICVLQHLNTF